MVMVIVIQCVCCCDFLFKRIFLWYWSYYPHPSRGFVLSQYGISIKNCKLHVVIQITSNQYNFKFTFLMFNSLVYTFVITLNILDVTELQPQSSNSIGFSGEFIQSKPGIYYLPNKWRQNIVQNLKQSAFRYSLFRLSTNYKLVLRPHENHVVFSVQGKIFNNMTSLSP